MDGENSDKGYATVPLDGVWDFTYRTDAAGTPTALAFDATMPVPARWDDHLDPLRTKPFWNDARFNPAYRPIEFPLGTTPPDATLPYLIGTGWYRTRVFIPSGWEGRILTLQVGGVSTEATVWLNGQLAGSYRGFSLPFTVRLGSPIRWGEDNELVIAVSNQNGNAWWGCGNRGYKGASGGIYRSVSLHSASSRIESCYAYPVKDVLRWQVGIEGAGCLDLAWSITGFGAGRPLAAGRFGVLPGVNHLECPLPRLERWSDREPWLYTLTVQLLEGERALDGLEQRVGFREIGVQGSAILLNGLPVYLRGTTEHAYFPRTCTPPIDLESYLSNLRKLKELGFNWIRFHTWIPPMEYLDAADLAGMLVQLEPPTHFEDEEWRSMVRLCRAHPSVILFCGGNEELLDEAQIERLARLASYQRATAPATLFSPQEALRGVDWGYRFEEFGEGLALQPFPHNPARLERLREFSDCFGQFTWGLLSYLSSYASPALIDRRLALHQRPHLTHENGIHGSYLNLDLAGRYEGTRIGPRLYEAAAENLRRAGVLARAPLYYQNSCRWMSLMRKHNLESTRKCRTITGYDLLAAVDHHWHRTGYPCGVMNEFYELKPAESPMDVLRYNGESVVLCDLPSRRSRRCCEALSVPVMISHYGPTAMRKAHLSWALKGRNRVYSSGRREIGDIPAGLLSELGRIEVTLPGSSTPLKLELVIRVGSDDYDVDNAWHLWAFPPALPAAAGGVMTVDALDEKALVCLDEGGAVLLLGTDPFPAERIGFQIGIAGRPSGNLATVLRDHIVLRDFVHDGYCDWQFHDLIESGFAVVCNELDMEFDPIVEVASSFKVVLKQAAMFEARVGKGRLFVCGFAFHGDDPAAEYLLELIRSYVSSQDFAPRGRLPRQEIERLLAAGHKRVLRRIDAPNLYVTREENSQLTASGGRIPNLLVVEESLAHGSAGVEV